MTSVLTKQTEHFRVEDMWPRKRAKFQGEFIESAQQTQRAQRRRKLDELYEQDKPDLESNIEQNINVELERCKRRKQTVAPKNTYDDETVKSMIAVALETQKEKLFATFIEQNMEDHAYFEQVIDMLFKTHALSTEAHIESYIN